MGKGGDDEEEQEKPEEVEVTLGGFRLPRQFVAIADTVSSPLTDIFVYPDLTPATAPGFEHAAPSTDAAPTSVSPSPPTPPLFVWPIVWVVEGLVGALAGGTDDIRQLDVALETLTILCKGVNLGGGVTW